jgi:hypothetical protein
MCTRGISLIKALGIQLKLVLDVDRILSCIPDSFAGLTIIQKLALAKIQNTGKEQTVAQRQRSLGVRRCRMWHIISVGSDDNPTAMVMVLK